MRWDFAKIIGITKILGVAYGRKMFIHSWFWFTHYLYQQKSSFQCGKIIKEQYWNQRAKYFGCFEILCVYKNNGYAYIMFKFTPSLTEL
jgi:hypothetical protein